MTLRRAAERVRDLAAAATPGPWRPSDTAPYASGDHWQDVYSPSGSVTVAHEEPCCLAADAQHIAFWDPPRAVLVAALLGAIAAEVEHDDLSLQRDLVDDPNSLICRAGYLLALDVLGEKPGDPS